MILFRAMACSSKCWGRNTTHPVNTQSYARQRSDTHFFPFFFFLLKLSQAQRACLDSTRGAICSCTGQFEETHTQESLRMQYGSHVNHQPSSFPLKISHWAMGKWGQFVIHNLFKKATFYGPLSVSIFLHLLVYK